MASELTVSAAMSFLKGGIGPINAPPQNQKKFTVAGSAFSESTQSIATTMTVVNLGGVGTLGWFFVVNTDATNYCDFFAVSTDAVPFIRLQPGEFFMGRLGCTAPNAKAHTAAVIVEMLLVEA
ncbi:MAG TPA: hypothetical protein VEL77_15185 [Rugosimonospora sp.]|nr:hypothetical protein [Rugosimonospora sp.]